MFCTKCGNELYPNDEFCAVCGTKVRKADDEVKRLGETTNPIDNDSIRSGQEPAESKELLGYLHDIYDLESNKYFLEQMIKREEDENVSIQADIDTLYLKKTRRPERVTLPRKPSFGEDIIGGAWGYITGYIQVSLIAFAIIVIAVTILLKNIMLALLIAVATISVICMIIAYFGKYQYQQGAWKEAIRRNENADYSFSSDCKKYDSEMKRKEFLLKEREGVVPLFQKQLAQLKKILNDYYALDILHNAYRSFEAVAYIIFYLESGQARTLSEAYTLCETAQYRKTIIRQNSEIIMSLRDIQESNKAIYESVTQVKNYISILHDDIQKQTNSIIDMNSNIESLNSSIGTYMNDINTSINNNTKMTEISNDCLKSIEKYEQYQAFAARQSRLESGHWT